MNEHINKDRLLSHINKVFCKPCQKLNLDFDGAMCVQCNITSVVDEIENFEPSNSEPVIHAADVAPRTDLGVLATARAIELLAASMEFLRNMDAIAGSETYMSILCEYDDTLNDGYCLLRDIEDFFEIVEDEE